MATMIPAALSVGKVIAAGSKGMAVSNALASAGIGAGTTSLLGAAGSTLASSVTLSGILSGAMGTASALSALGAGNQAAAEARSQAAFSDFRAKQEMLEGRKNALIELQNFNELQAGAIAAAGASGAGFGGSIAKTLEGNKADFEFNRELALTNAAVRSGLERGQAAQLRSRAKNAKTGGLLNAGTISGQMILRNLGR